MDSATRRLLVNNIQMIEFNQIQLADFLKDSFLFFVICICICVSCYERFYSRFCAFFLLGTGQ